MSASTREKVLARRAECLAVAANSPAGPSRLLPKRATVGEVAVWWLDNVHRHQVRPSTWSKAQDRVRRIEATLGDVPASGLSVERIVDWQSELLDTLAPVTVGHHRQTLGQVMDQAVELGLAIANPVRRVKAPKVPPSTGRALTVDETRALLGAVADHPYGAAIALLFLQGWRISEALGLAWDDLDLDHSTAVVRRASIYVDHVGPALGPPKTVGATGQHLLAPTVVTLLRRRREVQASERAAWPGDWPTYEWDGRVVSMVFTRPDGLLVTRQSVTKVLQSAARSAGIDTARLATHTGRRSVVTALYAEAGESIDEIARYVGHANPATTAGYVRSLGNRPAAFAARAASLLDPAAG